MHSTEAFGVGDVKSIAEFSYVLSFFTRSVHSGLLFFDKRRKRAQQVSQGAPPPPSQLNGALLHAYIPCSFVGAAIGMYMMPAIRESGARITLGGSSLFLALTLCSLYQIKFLERRKAEDVIRDDLMRMRIQSDVQRHVILQNMEDQKRRRARKERRRRHRKQRRDARRVERLQRREMRVRALTASTGSSTARGGGAAPSPTIAVPPVGGLAEAAAAMADREGAPLKPNDAPPAVSPFHSQHRTASLTSLRGRPYELATGGVQLLAARLRPRPARW